MANSICSNCEDNNKNSSIAEQKVDPRKQQINFSNFVTFVLICSISVTIWWIMMSSKCLIQMPAIMEEIFRPPANCKVCYQLGEIPRLRNVSPDEFMNRFAYSGIPAVVEDCTENWTAKSVFDVDFFSSLYALKNDSDCQFFRYKTNFSSLQQALMSINDGTKDVWYIGWSNCNAEISDVLRQHYNTPYFLTDDSEPASTDWIFMGTPGYGALKHIDNVKYPSWQAQIKGSKKWILYPPPECYYSCNQMQYEVVLNTGDTLVVDTNVWYHETYVISNEISISIGSEFD